MSFLPMETLAKAGSGIVAGAEKVLSSGTSWVTSKFGSKAAEEGAETVAKEGAKEGAEATAKEGAEETAKKGSKLGKVGKFAGGALSIGGSVIGGAAKGGKSIVNGLTGGSSGGGLDKMLKFGALATFITLLANKKVQTGLSGMASNMAAGASNTASNISSNNEHGGNTQSGSAIVNTSYNANGDATTNDMKQSQGKVTAMNATNTGSMGQDQYVQQASSNVNQVVDNQQHASQPTTTHDNDLQA